MRRIFLTVILFATASLHPVFSQDGTLGRDTLRASLGRLLQTVKKHSLYRAQVNWDMLEKEILQGTPDPLNEEDFVKRVRLTFDRVGDRHAALFIKGKRITGTKTPVNLRSALVRELKDNNPKLSTKILLGRYGYILVPSNTPRDNLREMAQGIQDSLCKSIDRRLEGIIVDLRANEGGSIYPLFTGLHQLIGEGVFGAFGNFDGTFIEPWLLKKGRFFQQKKVVASVSSKCGCSDQLKVAVLTSQLTASAGEMLAIALKGRENTIFIGERTYGLTTGNVTFNIDGFLLALSASFSQDRRGKVYNGPIIPDIELIEGDSFSSIASDKKVLEAIRWFSSSGGH